MVLNIIIAFVMWAVGMLLYSIGIMQILIVLFCAIPTTRKLSKVATVDCGYIYKRCTITIVTWLLISAAVFCAVFILGNAYVKYGFAIGVGISFLFSLGKWGANEANLQDYFKTYSCAIAQQDLERLFSSADDQPD